MNGALFDALETLWRGVALHLWQTSLVWLVLGAVWLAVRKAPARYPQALLWLGLLKLCVPAAALEPLVRAVAGTLGGAESKGLAGAIQVVLVPLGSSPAPLPEQAVAIWPAVLTALWLAGLSLLLLRTIRRQPEGAGSSAGGEARARIESAARSVGVDPGRVDVVDGAAVPAAVGWWRPRVVIPQRIAVALEPAELQAVLLHEMHHCRRHDPFLAGIQRLVLAVFFFYPPVWWLVARLRATAEWACDEAALARGVGPRVYGRALARVVRINLEHPAAAGGTGFGDSAGMRGRLIRIDDPRRERAMTRHKLLLAGFVLVLVGSVAGAAFVDGDAPGRSLNATKGEPARKGQPLDAVVGVDETIRIELRGVPLARVFEVLDDAVTPRFSGLDALPDKTVTVVEAAIPARELMLRLAVEHGLEYRVIDGWNVEVRVPERGPVLLAGVDGVTNPQLVSGARVQPVYPRKAREERVTGKAIFQAVVRKDGSVDELETLLERPEDHGFAEAAAEAIRQWRYEPATLDGEPVDVYFTIFMEFKLE